ncbi:MAG: DUF3450 family protein [Planctomycetota bacterium]
MEAIQRHDGPEQTRTARRSLLPALLISLALSAPQLTAQQGGAQDPAELAKAMRSAHAEYALAKRTISEEREAWRKGKQTLETQIQVLNGEYESFVERIAEAKKSIEAADKKYGELEKQKAELERVTKVLEQRITKLEQRTLALLERVPAPLALNVQTISQLLPENDEQREKLSLSVRYQNVMGVLNPIDKWNREVKLENERRDLPNGKSVSVTVLYVGLAQGYYVGGKGPDGKPNIAGVGTSTADGWRWTPSNELAADIAKAVSIYRNEQLAALVQLPVSIL